MILKNFIKILLKLNLYLLSRLGAINTEAKVCDKVVKA